MPQPSLTLPWLEAGDPFPDVALAWGDTSEAPGLLAAGGVLSTESLQRAYRRGIFPWFGPNQPHLWWSPDPRMVLQVAHFRLHRSLRKSLQRFVSTPNSEVRMDTAFEQVITACAQSPRSGSRGTWIVPAMVDAYSQLHATGHAHSVETWINGELVGGLYCVGLGCAVFGESMFSRRPDASKIALAALVAFCRRNAITMIDCQQNTAHLASLGALEMPRSQFIAHVDQVAPLPAPDWQFSPLYWDLVLRPPQSPP